MSAAELLPFWAMLACSALIYGAILWEVFPCRGARRAGREATDQEPTTPPPPVTGVLSSPIPPIADDPAPATVQDQITEGVYRVPYHYGKSFTVSKRPHGYAPGTRKRLPFETVATFPVSHQDALKAFLLCWLPDGGVGEDLYTGIVRKARDLHALRADRAEEAN